MTIDDIDDARMLREALRQYRGGNHRRWMRLMRKLDAAVTGRRLGLGSTPMFREFRADREMRRVIARAVG